LVSPSWYYRKHYYTPKYTNLIQKQKIIRPAHCSKQCHKKITAAVLLASIFRFLFYKSFLHTLLKSSIFGFRTKKPRVQKIGWRRKESYWNFKKMHMAKNHKTRGDDYLNVRVQDDHNFRERSFVSSSKKFKKPGKKKSKKRRSILWFLQFTF